MSCQDRRTAISILHGGLEHLRLCPGHRIHHRHCHGGHDARFSSLADASESCPSVQDWPDLKADQSRQGNPETALCIDCIPSGAV